MKEKLVEVSDYAEKIADGDNYACGLVYVNGDERMFVFKLPKEPGESSFMDIGKRLWSAFK